MDLRIQTRTLDLLNRLCIRGDRKVTQIPYYPQKTVSFSGMTETEGIPSVSPESVGIDSRCLTAFLSALEADRESNLHNLVILRNGKRILSVSAPGYSTRMWSLTHSMAKTVTAMAIGILVTEGKLSLDERICEIFPGELPVIVFPRTRKITVRHLLTMSSGVTGMAETASVTEEKWLRAFLESAPSFEPGSRFHYNSMNSYILGVIVRRKSGEELFAFLKSRLFEPLGIRNIFWEKSPEGDAKGGWGLYLPPEDMAKLGQLLLDGGTYGGKRIMDAAFVRETTSVQKQTADGFGDYHYGYHLWVARDGSAFLLNGMLGQNIWVCPKNRMVVVSTTGNREFYQQSTTLRLIASHFGLSFFPPERLPENRRAQRELSDRISSFFFARRWARPLIPKRTLFAPPARPLPEQCSALFGTYTCSGNRVGVLPLFIRMLQNNHSEGLTAVSFSSEEQKFWVQFCEGHQIIRFPVGFYGYETTELDFYGEKYLVSAMAQFAENEDGEKLLKLEMILPETPHARRIKIYFGNGKLRMQFSEVPGVSMLPPLLSSLRTNSTKRPILLTFAQQQINRDYVMLKIKQNMEPVVMAHKTNVPVIPAPPEQQLPTPNS